MAPAKVLVAASGAVVAGLLVARLFLSLGLECGRLEQHLLNFLWPRYR